MNEPTHVTGRARLPMPGVAKRGPKTSPPQTLEAEVVPPAATRYCSDPNHRTTEHCVAAMRTHNTPVNGNQLCALVAVKNGVLAFRSLMRWDDENYSSPQPPPEHATANEIWTKFERLINGCVDHVCEHMNSTELDQVLGVYVDFADPLRASLALAMRLYDYAQPSREVPELYRQLLRQMADDPVLKYIFEQIVRH